MAYLSALGKSASSLGQSAASASRESKAKESELRTPCAILFSAVLLMCSEGGSISTRSISRPVYTARVSEPKAGRRAYEVDFEYVVFDCYNFSETPEQTRESFGRVGK